MYRRSPFSFPRHKGGFRVHYTTKPVGMQSLSRGERRAAFVQKNSGSVAFGKAILRLCQAPTAFLIINVLLWRNHPLSLPEIDRFPYNNMNINKILQNIVQKA